MNIDSVLLNLGFLPNKASFLYIKAFVDMQDDCSFNLALRKIADNFNTGFNNVYDSIRRSIIIAKNSGKLKNIDSYFDIAIYDENYLLSVSEFLSLLKLLFPSKKNYLSA